MSVDSPYIAVVADDLTGSGDTAVQFVRAGWQTQLSVGRAALALADPGISKAQVLAVTTHTRAMEAAQAASVVRDDVAALRAAGVRRLYKKVDSTLRGPFRAEIEAARKAWRDDAIAVVCPAFPSVGRTLHDGVLFVDGRPVTETSAATDPVTPVTESHVPTLIGAALITPGAEEDPRVLAARIMDAGDCVVVDVVTEDDMALLAEAIVLMGERALPVGSGGLALPLAALWAREFQSDSLSGTQSNARRTLVTAAGTSAEDHVPAARSGGPAPVVVVVTSQHSEARQQAEALIREGARCWMPEPADLRETHAWEAYCRHVVASVRDDGPDATWLLLAPPGRQLELDSDAVAARLGELAACLIRTYAATGVVATGGDGARAVLEALDAVGITLVDEVTGGMPLGTLTGGAQAGLPVVTKAGGFGAPDVLIKAALAVRERRNSV